MSTNPHPRAQLSAYLDGALSTVERSAVDAHLDTCVDCRLRLAELRATASLIKALPDLQPSRRLVPRIATVPAWLAPLRTRTTLASGVTAFLFIASALLANVNQLAVPTSLQLPAAGGAAAAPAASQAERSSLGAAGTVTPAAQAPNASPAPSPGAALDTAKSFASPTAPPFAALNTTSPTTQDNASRTDVAEREGAHAATPSPQIGPSPWLWLVLTIVLGAIAFALQRRLRSL